MTTWLALDCNFLCHRAFHALGPLSHNGDPTAVMFGFLRDLLQLQERFETTNVIFCFDSGVSKRKEIYPDYKKSRVKDLDAMPAEEAAARRSFYRQVDTLQNKCLPYLGYRNIFTCPGYEADDCIARVCEWALLDAAFGNPTSVVMVSSDKDLYQWLGPRVSMWNPASKKYLTVEWFEETWGIHPGKWPLVKAIAGCATDDVPGVRGVGELTAVKYIRRELKKTAPTYVAIMAAEEQTARNMKLVRLPMNGCPRFRHRPDKCTNERWRRLAKKFGMSSIATLSPIPPAGVRQRNV